MPSDERQSPSANHPCHLSRENGADLVLSAFNHLRRILSSNGHSHRETNTACQKKELIQWADTQSLLIPPGPWLDDFKQGGQEHDLYSAPQLDRIFKTTRNGVFGLSPGIDLALVSSGQDPRRFHLWEASPYQYLERLHLQNLFTPGLNRLEGLSIENEELIILTSQPRFEILPVTQDEIDAWFVSLGFEKITTSAYYRSEDKLGIFDAHDKNVLRSLIDDHTLIPFDVIPVYPDKNFHQFIQDTLNSDQSLHLTRTTHTTSRSS